MTKISKSKEVRVKFSRGEEIRDFKIKLIEYGYKSVVEFFRKVIKNFEAVHKTLTKNKDE